MVHASVAEHWIRAVVRPTTGRVRQQMLNANVLDVLPVRRFAVLRPKDVAHAKDLVRQTQSLAFDQSEDCRRCDWFGEAGDAEKMIGGHLLIAALVRQTKS